jgi:hypothetical protein
MVFCRCGVWRIMFCLVCQITPRASSYLTYVFGLCGFDVCFCRSDEGGTTVIRRAGLRFVARLIFHRRYCFQISIFVPRFIRPTGGVGVVWFL